MNSELRAIISRHNAAVVSTSDDAEEVNRVRAQSAKRKEAADVLRAENNALRYGCSVVDIKAIDKISARLF